MLKQLLKKYKILRGMLSYGILWPSGNLTVQIFVEKKSFRDCNWGSCLRDSLYGAFFLAPNLYVWVRFLDIAWPKRCLKSAFQKVFAEQISIDPYVIGMYFYGISIMEGKNHNEAVTELKKKYFKTYKRSCIYWPVIQLVNFAYVKTGYQVVVISIASFFWTIIMAAIKADNHTMPIDTPKEYIFQFSSNKNSEESEEPEELLKVKVSNSKLQSKSSRT